LGKNIKKPHQLPAVYDLPPELSKVIKWPPNYLTVAFWPPPLVVAVKVDGKIKTTSFWRFKLPKYPSVEKKK
jgi:hypothetical protein